MIQISAQYGGPKAGKIIRPLHHNFNQIFEKTLNKKYFVKLEKLEIVLRVSGQVTDFEGDGPEILKYRKKWNLVTPQEQELTPLISYNITRRGKNGQIAKKPSPKPKKKKD